MVSDSTDRLPTPLGSVRVADVTTASTATHGSPSSADASAAPSPSAEGITEKR